MPARTNISRAAWRGARHDVAAFRVRNSFPPRFLNLFLAFALTAALMGCGQSAERGPQAKGPDRTAQGDSTRKSSSRAKPGTSPANGKNGKTTNGSGRRQATQSPGLSDSNVFFARPLEVVREGRSADAGSRPLRIPKATDGETNDGTSPSRDSSTDDAPAAGAADWGSLLTAEDLAQEAQSIRARITDKMLSIGKYNAGYKELRQDAATLAALATIAREHPAPPSWRRYANEIRDLAATIANAATAPGDGNYQSARGASDQLEALLAGNAPGQLKESGEKTPISELVTRVPLMYRMERSLNGLKLTVSTEPQFRKESARVAHEGALLATLARVIADAGYPDADLDEYRAHSTDLSRAGLAIVRAAQEADFRAYTTALDRCAKACTGCHQEFKNN
ncbi:MAG: hypothetical protein ACT4QC_02865 [Planctomycetaceae bacterium]